MFKGPIGLKRPFIVFNMEMTTDFPNVHENEEFQKKCEDIHDIKFPLFLWERKFEILNN
jgi:hypothetical protein